MGHPWQFCPLRLEEKSIRGSWEDLSLSQSEAQGRDRSSDFGLCLQCSRLGTKRKTGWLGQAVHGGCHKGVPRSHRTNQPPGTTGEGDSSYLGRFFRGGNDRFSLQLKTLYLVHEVTVTLLSQRTETERAHEPLTQQYAANQGQEENTAEPVQPQSPVSSHLPSPCGASSGPCTQKLLHMCLIANKQSLCSVPWENFPETGSRPSQKPKQPPLEVSIPTNTPFQPLKKKNFPHSPPEMLNPEPGQEVTRNYTLGPPLPSAEESPAVSQDCDIRTVSWLEKKKKIEAQR